MTDSTGYRNSVVLSEVSAAAGLERPAFLPETCTDPFAGTISVFVYAVGNGMTEVLFSPAE